jgi:PAS domain S-box-containing protein
LHAFLEVSGGGIAAAVGFLLIAQVRESDQRHLIWCVGGLFGMGLLDMAHGAWAYGAAWSWLRALATAAGGSLFALVWLPARLAPARQPRRFISIVVVAVCAQIVLVGLLRHDLPLMWNPNGNYTLWTRLLNTWGATGFLLAAVFFFGRYTRTRGGEDLVLGSHALLFSTAGFLIWFSRNWHIEWWLWHGMRLVAYGVIVRAAYVVVVSMQHQVLRHKMDLEHAIEQDRAERKQTQQALRESEDRLRLFIEHAPAAIAMFDRELCYLAVSNRWKRDYDLPDDIIGRCHYDVFPDLPEHWKDACRRGLAGEVSRADEDPLVRADGKLLWVRWEVLPWYTAGGEIGGILLAAEEITGPVLAKQALRQSERQLRLVTDNVPVLIVQCDANARFRFVNAPYAARFGQTPEQVVGKHIRDIVGHAAFQALACHVENALHGQRVEFEDKIPYEDVGPRWMHCIYVPQLETDGRPNGFVAVIQDVTWRKQTEEALRQQLDLTQTITDNATTAIFMTNAEGRCSFMNPAAERMTGFRFDDVKNGVLHDFIHHHHPDGRPFSAADCPVDRALPGRFTVVDHEDTFIRRNGEFFPVLLNAKPIRREGKAAGTVIEVRDVTEQKSVELALRENEAVLRTVTTEAQVGLVIVNQDRRYVFANQTYTDILGLPDADIVGKRVADVLPGVYEEQIQSRLDRAIDGERVTYELRFAEAAGQGDERFYEVTYEPRADHRGRYVVVVLVDVTDRKRAQEILERTVAERTAKLQETVGELEGFSYSITHDLRAPLRAIQGFSQMLEEEYAPRLDATARDFLRRISTSVGRMDKLIQDVLVYSRVLRMDLKLEPVNISALLRGMLESYPDLQEPNARVTIDGDLPPVLGNEAALTQCFSNLLNNAVKFVPPHTKPRVRIWAENGSRVASPANGSRQAGVVRFWIEDNGIGIDAQYADSIFGMFQRLSNQYEGTGIGLTIVRKAVERMGGSVGVVSEPGRGSHFWLRLQATDKLQRNCE